MGVPVRTQRRWAFNAQTALAIFVLGFRMLWPSSRTIRYAATKQHAVSLVTAPRGAYSLTFHDTWNKLPCVFLFFLVAPSSPAFVAAASACSFVTVWYVVITTSYFFSSSGVIARVAP